MKLIDLTPKWVASNVYRKGMGISFKCPHCEDKIIVFFLNPLDGGFPDFNCKFTRVGEKFETVTIFPSIDISDHWSGFITNGEIITIL